MTDHVDSEVYDVHEAFEIDKTKMKMLVPLDMNGKQILNTNFDLKFTDIFKIINCYVTPPSQTNLLYHMLTEPLLHYDEIYLYAKNLEQEKYQNLMNKLNEKKQRCGL